MIVEMIKNVQILTLGLLREITCEEVEEGLHFHVKDLFESKTHEWRMNG